MIGGIFSFLGALLKAVPLFFLIYRGEIMPQQKLDGQGEGED